MSFIKLRRKNRSYPTRWNYLNVNVYFELQKMQYHFMWYNRYIICILQKGEIILWEKNCQGVINKMMSVDLQLYIPLFSLNFFASFFAQRQYKRSLQAPRLHHTCQKKNPNFHHTCLKMNPNFHDTCQKKNTNFHHTCLKKNPNFHDSVISFTKLEKGLKTVHYIPSKLSPIVALLSPRAFLAVTR